MSDLSRTYYKDRLVRAKRMARLIMEDGIKIPEQIDIDAIKYHLNRRREYFNTRADVEVADSGQIFEKIARYRCWEPRATQLKLHSDSIDAQFKNMLHLDVDTLHKRSGYSKKLREYIDELLPFRLGELYKIERTLRLSLTRLLFDNTRAAKEYRLSAKWMGVFYAFDWQIVSFSDFLRSHIYYRLYEESVPDPEKSPVAFLAEAFGAGLGFVLLSNKGDMYGFPFPRYYLNSRGQLHKDLGPAVEWSTGTYQYYLNGVLCPKDVVMNKAENIDPHIVITERNAEVRREIVRKIGLERLCNTLDAKCIDKQENYELLVLNLKDGQRRPFLKMVNPSIGVYHIEGVPPNIATVQQALKWRNGTNETPIQLT